VHVIDVTLIPNTQLAVSVCYSGIAKVWNWQESRPLRQFTDHRNQVEGVAWISGTKVLTTGRDDSMYIWDVNSGEVVARLENSHAGGVRAVSVHPNGRQAITADYTGKIGLWNVESGNEHLVEMLQPISETHEIWSIDWVADTQRIVIGGLYASGKSLLAVMDIETGEIVREFTRLTGRVYGVRVSRNGKYLFSAADSVAGWSLYADSDDARPLFEFKRHNDNTFSVDESPDGTLLATGGTDGRVWIFPWRPMTDIVMQ
jgi:WD40 repeat protein